MAPKKSSISNPRVPIPQLHCKYSKSHQNITNAYHIIAEVQISAFQSIQKNVQNIQKSYKPLTRYSPLSQ
jgi:hypothetical protein